MSARYFPWRLYRKFFLTLLILLNATFFAALLLTAIFFDVDWSRSSAPFLVACFFFLSLGGAALLAYKFVLPLRRVIFKALRLANKKHVSNFVDSDEDLFEIEPGEYFELEQALDKIRKKLKKRRLELAHEREESQTLMSCLQDAVVSIGRDGRVNFYNSRFATLFVGPEQLRMQKEGHPLVLTGIFRDPQILSHINMSFLNGSVERFQGKMGTAIEPHGRHFSVAISPLREEKTREIYGSLIVFHDISDLKKAEQIRIEFVENASHELRTPLTSIKGYLETARDDLAEGRVEQVPQFLGIISKSVDRLGQIVNDMLTISSLENMTGIRLELIHPEIVTQDVFERLSPLASEKSIMLKLVDEAEPFKADPILVEQVLENLIGNAIKYIQESGQIEVRWSLDADEKMVIMRVRDNGPGIADEHLERLFERFYRVEKSRSRDVGGTGLGLAIVKHIMQSHGGSIQVSSRAGTGAEFICLFPFRT